MKIRDTNKVGKGNFGRWYQVYYESKRVSNPEEGVSVTEYDHKWDFEDTKLGFPLRVKLHERVYRGKANLTASVIFEHVSNARVGQVDEYVVSQLEQVAKDGMVKL